MNDRSTKQRLVSGVLWMTVVRALSQSITWVITIFVVRLLTPADYGLMGMALIVSGFLTLFSEVGLGVAIIQRSTLRDEQLSTLGWVILAVNVLFFGVVALAAPLIASYFNEPRLMTLVPVLGTMFVLQGLGAPSGYLLQRRMEFREKATAELIASVAGGIATLIGALAGMGVWSLAVGYLVPQLVMNGLYYFHAPFPFRLAFSMRDLREHIGFGGQVALARVLWYISSNADFLVVGRLLGSVQLGFYGLAFQFSSLPIDKLVSIVSQVAFPSFASLQNQDATLTRYFLKLTSIVALVTFPILVGLALVADVAVELFLTSKWVPVVVPLQMLCIVACFRAVEILCHPLVIAKGQPRISVWNSLLQVIVLPIAFVIGAVFDGLRGVALAWLVTRPFIFYFVTALTIRTIRLPLITYLGVLRHPVAGCLLMSVAVFAVRGASGHSPLAIQVALASGVGCVAYAAYQLLFNQEMLREAFDVVRSRQVPVSPAVGGSNQATATL